MGGNGTIEQVGHNLFRGIYLHRRLSSITINYEHSLVMSCISKYIFYFCIFPSLLLSYPLSIIDLLRVCGSGLISLSVSL